MNEPTKEELREQLGRWLRTYKLNEVETDDHLVEDGITPWDKISQNTRNYWLKDANLILDLPDLASYFRDGYVKFDAPCPPSNSNFSSKNY